jgi:TRAP transporter TAXI family solute receptor
MKKYKLFAALCIMVVGLFLLTGCPAPQEEAQEEEPAAEPQFFDLGGGPSGGSFAAFAAALSEVINDDLADLVNLTPTGTAGSSENIVFVSDGEIDLGLADGMSLYRAFSGIAPFEGTPHENLRAIGLVTFATLHFVTMADSGIETIEDLAGRRVAVGTVGSATEQNIMAVTDFLGIWDEMQKEQLLGGDAVTALQDGHVDAFGWSATHPHGSIEDLTTLHEIRVLDSLTSAKAAGFFDEYPFFWEGVIPAGTYGIPADVPVVLSGLYLFAHKDLDADLVYAMTKLIYESNERLTGIHAHFKNATLDNAVTGLAIPLHAGAQRFFEEAGLEIPEAIQTR